MGVVLGYASFGPSQCSAMGLLSRPVCPHLSWTRFSKARRGSSRSARCTWRKAWSSALSRSWPVTDVLPLQERLKTVADEAELEDVYNTERHLLYVACTRARDHLMVSSTAPASEFLTDLLR